MLGLQPVGHARKHVVQSSATPLAVTGLTGVKAIAGGTSHTCALLVAGTVRCWGSNSGELGQFNGFTFSATPLQVTGLRGPVLDGRHPGQLRRVGQPDYEMLGNQQLGTARQ